MSGMRKGTTKSGFNFSIDENVLDNWDIVELFMKADSGDTSAFMEASKLVLGEKQFDNFKKFIAKKNNGVPRFSLMISELKEIFDAIGEVKN